jgi:hypothetical protein
MERCRRHRAGSVDVEDSGRMGEGHRSKSNGRPTTEAKFHRRVTETPSVPTSTRASQIDATA